MANEEDALLWLWIYEVFQGSAALLDSDIQLINNQLSLITVKGECQL